ncbi:MAG: hypothetical protein AAB670_01750 [Patescibacteria group bacterium]
MKLERSSLDSIGTNLFRSMMLQEALAEKLGGSGAIILVENSLNWAKKLLPIVDGFFSSVLTDQGDLIQYAVRAKACMEKIEVLEHSLAILKKRGEINGMDRINALVAIGYLEGELKGLKFTMEEMQDRQKEEMRSKDNNS